MSRTRKELRELLNRDTIVLQVSIHDAMSAQLAEEAGIEVVAVGGYNSSLSLLGLPDAGYLTMTEMVRHCRNVADSVDIPVVGDMDTGFGNALNVRRTVEEAIKHTDLAGIHIEDQEDPKRCGHVSGRRLVSTEEAVGKFRAAADVRDELDEDFVLYARTDAVGAVDGGIDEAIERGNRYYEAGADLVWVEGPTSMEQVERIADEIDAPLKYNNLISAGGISPMVDRETLQDLGYDIVHYMGSLVPTMTAVYDYMEGLKEGDVEFDKAYHAEREDHPVGDVHEFAGFDRVYELEDEYLPEEDQEKYAQSEGYVPPSNRDE